jgi:hypothetical protein
MYLWMYLIFSVPKTAPVPPPQTHRADAAPDTDSAHSEGKENRR